MTEKVPLEAMLRRASRMAENMFECDGEVSLLARRDGGLEKLPRQGGHPSDRTAVTGWPGDDGLWFFQTHYD